MSLRLGGTVHVPGDKSISHRALLLSALATGTSRVRGLLPSADVRSTAGALRALGASVPDVDAGGLVVAGVGGALRQAGQAIDAGNSGTTARLLAGVLAAQRFTTAVTGDASLRSRPMGRVARPLRAMGATLAFDGEERLPVRITGGPLVGITWRPEVASAQVKGAILLAGLCGGVPVEIHEPQPTRDHTERMLRARGIDVRSEPGIVTLIGGGRLLALDTDVPGDPSSAAFFAALAALAGAGQLELPGVCTNPGRIGVFRVLERMGARIGWEDFADASGEPTATLVAAPRELLGTTVEPEEVPGLIDELPVLACVAARARGETRVTGAAELRVKESDRIALVVRNLRAVGAEAEELPDGFVVRGTDRPFAGRVETSGDHRIAMAFGVLGAATGGQITVDDPTCVDVSYPSFWSDLSRVAG